MVVSVESNDERRSIRPFESVKPDGDYIVLGEPVSLLSDPIGIYKSIIGDEVL